MASLYAEIYIAIAITLFLGLYMHKRRSSDNDPSITITFHNMEKLMSKKWLFDTLALVATIHSGSGTDPKIQAAVDDLTARLADNDASDSEVKQVVDSLVNKLANSTPATGGGTGAVPSVSSISPSAGSVNGGESVVIAGSGLTGATGVKFGAVDAASFTVDSDSQITAVSPAQVAGTVPVSVSNANGPSASAPSYTLS